MNWNTNVISSAATGTLQPVLTVMPTNLKTMTWSFATGECGSENWAGIQPNALVLANVQNWLSMGKFYIISTGARRVPSPAARTPVSTISSTGTTRPACSDRL